MSDIPVGSPPAPPGRHAAPGGWYPDPVDLGQERYWDGWQWSRNTRPREATLPTPQRPFGTEPQNPYATPPGQPSSQPGYAPAAGSARNQAAATADGVPLASWWWRLLATIVDNILVGIVTTALSFPLYRPMIAALSTYFSETVEAARTGGTPPVTPSTTDLLSTGNQFLLVLVTLGVGLAYHLMFLRWRAATPGKLLCGLRVVPLDQGRATGQLPWNTVVVRASIWVLPNANAVLGIFQLIDGLFPLWQPKRQALHDIAARTQVVRLR
ncbi:MAG TPA: RDD family protein [Propionibacteriaceae bacterium]